MKLIAAVAACAVLGALAGCSDDTVTGVSAPDVATAPPASPFTPPVYPGPEPKELTCPGGEMVGTAGGLMLAGADPGGVPTRAEVVEDWMEEMKLDGSYRLFADGTGAWILRADGTAEARMGILQVDDRESFYAHGYDMCQASVTTSE